MRAADKSFPSRGIILPVLLGLRVLALLALALVIVLPVRPALAETFTFTSVRIEGSTNLAAETQNLLSAERLYAHFSLAEGENLSALGAAAEAIQAELGIL